MLRATQSFTMDIAVFTPHELSTALGAVRALAPELNEVQQRFLRILATMHGVAVDPAVLPVPTPAETAAVITDPQRRKWLFQLAAGSTLLANPCSPLSQRGVAELAAALGVDDSTVQAHLSRCSRSVPPAHVQA